MLGGELAQNLDYVNKLVVLAKKEVALEICHSFLELLSKEEDLGLHFLLKEFVIVIDAICKLPILSPISVHALRHLHE